MNPPALQLTAPPTPTRIQPHPPPCLLSKLPSGYQQHCNAPPHLADYQRPVFAEPYLQCHASNLRQACSIQRTWNWYQKGCFPWLGIYKTQSSWAGFCHQYLAILASFCPSVYFLFGWYLVHYADKFGTWYKFKKLLVALSLLSFVLFWYLLLDNWCNIFGAWSHLMITQNWVNSDWWAVKKTTGSDKCGYHLNENADDWTWKIQNFFWEKSNAAPKEELISLVCKCR